MIKVKISGFAELEKKLQALPAQVRRGGIILRGLQKGADLIKADAKQRAPELKEAQRMPALGGRKRGYSGSKWRRKGALRAGITTQKVGGEKLMVLVRVRSRGYIFARRTFRARRDRLRNPALAGNPNYWWLVEFGTSKMAARPFMRPAFEVNKFRALSEIRSAMAEEIRQAAANPTAYAANQAPRSRRGRGIGLANLLRLAA